MKLEKFSMERLQSTWENRVAWNVSESGVHPLRVEEVAETDDERHALLAQALGYPQTNGTLALRRTIAEMYRGATADHVQVTNGGSGFVPGPAGCSKPVKVAIEALGGAGALAARQGYQSPRKLRVMRSWGVVNQRDDSEEPASEATGAVAASRRSRFRIRPSSSSIRPVIFLDRSMAKVSSGTWRTPMRSRSSERM